MRKKRKNWVDTEAQVPTVAVVNALAHIQNAIEMFKKGQEFLLKASDVLELEPYDCQVGYLAGKLNQMHTALNILVFDDLVCEKYNWDTGEIVPQTVALPSGSVMHPRSEAYDKAHPETPKVVEAKTLTLVKA